MQIKIIIIHFFRNSLKLIVFTVNEHKNICIAGLNRRAGYATDNKQLRLFLIVNIVHCYHRMKRNWPEPEENVRQLETTFTTRPIDSTVNCTLVQMASYSCGYIPHVTCAISLNMQQFNGQ